MGAPLRRAVVALLLRLASKAQFAKDKGMARGASSCLAALANLAPDLVLPLVHKHFATALETVTAARQMVPAIQTLSLCVRPLLVAGLAPPHEPGGSGGADGGGGACAADRRAAACQAVAAAMMATLPGAASGRY
eukprot:scaffold12.g8246.t1